VRIDPLDPLDPLDLPAWSGPLRWPL